MTLITLPSLSATFMLVFSIVHAAPTTIRFGQHILETQARDARKQQDVSKLRDVLNKSAAKKKITSDFTESEAGSKQLKDFWTPLSVLRDQIQDKTIPVKENEPLVTVTVVCSKNHKVCDEEKLCSYKNWKGVKTTETEERCNRRWFKLFSTCTCSEVCHTLASECSG